MKKYKKIYSLLIFLISLRLISQVGINTTNPNPKAALHVMSKNNNTESFSHCLQLHKEMLLVRLQQKTVLLFII